MLALTPEVVSNPIVRVLIFGRRRKRATYLVVFLVMILTIHVEECCERGGFEEGRTGELNGPISVPHSSGASGDDASRIGRRLQNLGSPDCSPRFTQRVDSQSA
jgi:hypothetical protein